MTEPAKTPWPYPRHRDFQKTVREAASQWFQQKGYPTDLKYPFILADWKDWKDWPKNIILPEVAEFIRGRAEKQREGGKNFPLHKYIHHGLSSQAMLFNLMGPLLIKEDLTPLRTLVEKKGVAWPGDEAMAWLEYEDRAVFNENRGQPTSIDLAIATQDGQPRIFIEAKFTEQEFGGCSVFQAGDCDGRNPAMAHEQCYLHHIGRKYWSLMQKFGIDRGKLTGDSVCIMALHYQFFRELLFALEKGGIFILLSDERSPVFRCDSPQGERGLMPLLIGLLPEELKDKVVIISIQELAHEIVAYQDPDWIHDFAVKYRLEILPRG